MPNQTPAETEDRILKMTEQFPTYRSIRLSHQLRLTGLGVFPAAVRAVWQRHGLSLRIDRLLWLEKKSAAAVGILTERPKARSACSRSTAAAPSTLNSTSKHPVPAYSGRI